VTIRNSNERISLAQTADGYLGQITENLQRMAEVLATTPGGNAETIALIAENTRINTLVVNSAVVTGGPTAAYGLKPTITGTIGSVGADLTAVTTARTSFGADMSALASSVASLQVASVNLSAAFSRIMDTDYAAESTSMTRNTILQQAGTAVLAQANQTPNSVLTLLR